MIFLTTFIPTIKLYNSLIKLFSILDENIKKNLGFSHFLCHLCKFYLIFHCSKKIMKGYCLRIPRVTSKFKRLHLWRNPWKLPVSLEVPVLQRRSSFTATYLDSASLNYQEPHWINFQSCSWKRAYPSPFSRETSEWTINFFSEAKCFGVFNLHNHPWWFQMRLGVHVTNSKHSSLK